MRITKLEPSKHKKGRFLVQLDSGDLLRVGEDELVRFALYSGKELDEAERAALEAAARTGGFRDKALSTLTARPMSRRDLIARLKDKDASDAEAEEVADWLERLGLLNDAEYAKALVRHYADKGYGPYKLRDELYRRGVPKQFWDAALEEAQGPEEAIDALLRQKLKGARPDRKELKKASDALARRGFRWQDISAALRRYGAEIEDE